MKKILTILLFIILLLPHKGRALEMPKVESFLPTYSDFTAAAYIVIDADSNSVILEKNSSVQWVPASLTKLITALVFLDTKPNLKKVVTMKSSDQLTGGCKQRGACIVTSPGVSYKLNDLLKASLIASANNATAAIARSTGLTTEIFLQKMNEKAKSLGAVHTTFIEPTGMSPLNTTTASDYAKITSAAFSNKLIQNISVTQSVIFSSVNNKKYSHTLKNTNKLLTDSSYAIFGGKTGYLEESLYNFTTEIKDNLGNHFVVVIFGCQSGSAEFGETKNLISLAGLLKSFGPAQAGVLGSSSNVSALK